MPQARRTREDRSAVLKREKGRGIII